MRLSNKIRQTVAIGKRTFVGEVRDVRIHDGVMKGNVRLVTPDHTTKKVPVRCVNGHRVWVPVK